MESFSNFFNKSQNPLFHSGGHGSFISYPPCFWRPRVSLVARLLLFPLRFRRVPKPCTLGIFLSASLLSIGWVGSDYFRILLSFPPVPSGDVGCNALTCPWPFYMVCPYKSLFILCLLSQIPIQWLRSLFAICKVLHTSRRPVSLLCVFGCYSCSLLQILLKCAVGSDN